SVVTGTESSVEVVFVDQTTFSLGNDARMTIDKLVYNPDGDGNGLEATIAKGAFVFLTGAIAPAKGEGVQVDSPAAVIGVRGTSVAAAPLEGGKWAFTVLPDPGTQHVGRVTVSNQFGVRILDKAYETTLGTRDGPLEQTIVLTPEQVRVLFKG